MAGGNRLMRFSPGMVASSCLAIFRLWAAKASRGDNEGGISPSLYIVRGEGRPRPSLHGRSKEMGSMSMNVGLCWAIVVEERESERNLFFGFAIVLTATTSVC
jgi:hypothetical protein